MGFFQDLKQDLSQAVNEMVGCRNRTGRRYCQSRSYFF